MNITLSFLFFLTILTSGCGCSNKQQSIQSKSDQPKLYVVNVLDKSLYDDCHIKGSINVPFEEFNNWINQKLENKEIDINDHIIVYCSNYMCTASGFGAKLLNKMGFKNSWAYEAGVAEWFQKKHPVEGICKKAYLTKTLDKPEHTEEGIQVITTEDLAEKINKMQK